MTTHAEFDTLEAERDQLREQLGVAREQHDNITRAMQERIEQAKAERDQAKHVAANHWTYAQQLKAERDRYRAALSRVQFELKHPSMDRSEVARAKTIVEQALNEDMRDELVAENAPASTSGPTETPKHPVFNYAWWS